MFVLLVYHYLVLYASTSRAESIFRERECMMMKSNHQNQNESRYDCIHCSIEFVLPLIHFRLRKRCKDIRSIYSKRLWLLSGIRRSKGKKVKSENFLPFYLNQQLLHGCSCNWILHQKPGRVVPARGKNTTFLAKYDELVPPGSRHIRLTAHRVGVYI